MIQFTEQSVDKIHYFLQNAKQPDMVLRIEFDHLDDEGEAKYKFLLEPQEQVRPKDLTMPAHGFYVRMDAKAAIKLANRVVDWVSVDGKAGFAIKPANEDLDPEHQASLSLYDRIVSTLQTIYDPEIPVNIYDMGLIYNIDIDQDKKVDVLMTLTAPNCPAAESLPEEVKEKINEIEEVSDVDLTLTWEPAWTPDQMSEEARLELGM